MHRIRNMKISLNWPHKGISWKTAFNWWFRDFEIGSQEKSIILLEQDRGGGTHQKMSISCFIHDILPSDVMGSIKYTFLTLNPYHTLETT